MEWELLVLEPRPKFLRGNQDHGGRHPGFGEVVGRPMVGL